MLIHKLISDANRTTSIEGACAGDGTAGVAATAGTEIDGMSCNDIFHAEATRTIDEGNARVISGTTSTGAALILGGSRIAGTLLILLGASNNSNEDGTTFDCWKPVIHDESKEPSRGMLLKDIYSHPNVLKVTATEGNRPDLPKIFIENIWNEVFKIEYLWVHATENIICHAVPI